MDRENFFILHQDLPREGPGEPADVDWVFQEAGLGPASRICDAGCGPGGDIPALLAAAPEGHVTAIEAHAGFVEDAKRRFSGEPRVHIEQGNMAEIAGPFDLIWCAGALYFLGIEAGLGAWRGALAPGGVVAFSEPCWFGAPWSDTDFWGGYEAGTSARIADRVRSAGYETLATRALSDAAWDAYYRPMEARIAALRDGASEALAVVLDEGQKEADDWRAMKRETGYLLSIVRPL